MRRLARIDADALFVDGVERDAADRGFGRLLDRHLGLDGAVPVRRHEAAYSARPESFRRMLDRSRPYLFHIMNEVERRGMPTEIAFLPLVESAFNAQAVSSAKAAGLWQFMPATGRHYGLEQTVWYDGRRDVLAATQAALDYLQNLYGMFGDWHLALAA